MKQTLDSNKGLCLAKLQSNSSQKTDCIGGGGGGNSKKVNTHPKIPKIDLDFFRLF